jgi:LPS export ABC transporter protein LptC
MKKSFQRQWPLIGLALLLVFVGFYLVRSGEESSQQPPAQETLSAEEGVKLRDIHYTHEDPEKKVKWVLDAAEVTFSQDHNYISFLDFQLHVKPKDRPTIIVTGKRGDYTRDSGVIRLWGDLEANSADGYRFQTEQMVINEKLRELRSDKPVKVLGPFFAVSGTGMIADWERKTVKILSNVTTTIEKGAFRS